jgi:hypothetical protein
MDAQYAKGDRFEDKDWRSEGRIIEVTEVDETPDGSIEYVAVVEANPKNPGAVGHETRLAEKTLARRYRKISR